MQYFISFLEGVITFISPCLLPMLPVYISYFAGGEAGSKKTILNALGFIFGFTLVFVAMGALAGVFGAMLTRYKTAVDIVTGALVVFFGLNFLGVFKLNLFRGGSKRVSQNLGFFSSLLFGVAFSVGWTPCVGAFLGSALMLASSTGGAVKGARLLLTYSLGLGIPFLISALLIEQLQTTFTFVKKHYKIINNICGVFLIFIGVMMTLGLMNYVLAFFS